MNDNGRVKITIRNVLLREHSRQQMLQVVNFVGEDPMRLKALIEIFLSGKLSSYAEGCLAAKLLCKKNPVLRLHLCFIRLD